MGNGQTRSMHSLVSMVQAPIESPIKRSAHDDIGFVCMVLVDTRGVTSDLRTQSTLSAVPFQDWSIIRLPKNHAQHSMLDTSKAEKASMPFLPMPGWKLICAPQTSQNCAA